MLRLLFCVVLILGLSACKPANVSDGSIWMICDHYQDICDDTHSGALCSIERNDTIRAVAKNREQLSSRHAYLALRTLDNYQECLENAYVSETVRNKADKQSQITTIRRISEVQKDILASTRSIARPEVNLWLWQRSQDDSYLESMKNGVEMVEEVHEDVYVTLMSEIGKKDLEKAREFARAALDKANIIADIHPAVYEFYVGYYLQKGDLHKAAVWQGLYSALDESRARINESYFRLHEKMSRRALSKAASEVDSLLFDARWLNKSMDEFPTELI